MGVLFQHDLFEVFFRHKVRIHSLDLLHKRDGSVGCNKAKRGQTANAIYQNDRVKCRISV